MSPIREDFEELKQRAQHTYHEIRYSAEYLETRDALHAGGEKLKSAVSDEFRRAGVGFGKLIRRVISGKPLRRLIPESTK